MRAILKELNYLTARPITYAFGRLRIVSFRPKAEVQA